jgi:serine/threonine-protein kinase
LDRDLAVGKGGLSMFQFRVLGSLDLRAPDGEEVLSVLSQPKRTAILVYLALASPQGFLRRDKLAGLFWPEVDQEHARGSLRGAIHFLRRSLGADVVLSRGDEDIALNGEHFSCDAFAFQEALKAEDLEAALDLFQGDLLEGFFLSGCPEFERWVDGERERFRELAAGAAWGLAHQHLGAGRITDGERLGQRALGLICTDESEARRFIEALAEAGDRAAAVRFHERFGRVLWDTLELEPSSETKALVEKIREGASPGPAPSSGAAFVPDPPDTVGPSPMALDRSRTTGEMAAPPAVTSTPVQRAATGVSNRYKVGMVVVAAAALVAWGIWVLRPGGQSDLNPRVVAVMPFENRTGDPGWDWIGPTTSMLIEQALAETGLVEIRPFEMTFLSDYHAQTQVEGESDSPRLAAFASEAGAGTVIHGAFVMNGDQVRLDALVTDVASGVLLRSIGPVMGDSAVPMDVIEALQSQVMGAMAMEFDSALAPYVDQIAHSVTAEAAREFAQGARLYLVEGDYEAAQRRLLRAHESDPNFFTALVWAGWNAEYNLGTGTETVLQRDSIWTILFDHQSDLSPYERAVTRGWQARVERDREGYARALEEACDIAPGSMACFDLAVVLFQFLHRPEAAIEVFTTRLVPERGWLRGWAPYWTWLAWAHHVMCDFTSELEVAREYRTLYPESTTAVEVYLAALAGLGRVDEVFSFLTDSLHTVGGEPTQTRLIGRIGNYLFHLGEDGEAIRAWELAVGRYEDLITADPSSVFLHLSAGHELRSLGRRKEAKEHWEAAESLNPVDRYARASLGIAAAWEGNESDARATMAWLDTQLDNRWNWDFRSRLTFKAFIAEALGEEEEAVDYLRELWTHPDMYQFPQWWRLDVFPALRGYPAYEEFYWPEGCGER